MITQKLLRLSEAWPILAATGFLTLWMAPGEMWFAALVMALVLIAWTSRYGRVGASRAGDRYALPHRVGSVQGRA